MGLRAIFMVLLATLVLVHAGTETAHAFVPDTSVSDDRAPAMWADAFVADERVTVRATRLCERGPAGPSCGLDHALIGASAFDRSVVQSTPVDHITPVTLEGEGPSSFLDPPRL